MSRSAIISLLLATGLVPGAALAMHPESKDAKARAEYCRERPDECTRVNEERRATLREWCENNPVDCDEERQALMELHREKLRKARSAKHEARAAAMEPGRRIARPEEPEARRETRTGPPR